MRGHHEGTAHHSREGEFKMIPVCRLRSVPNDVAKTSRVIVGTHEHPEGVRVRNVTSSHAGHDGPTSLCASTTGSNAGRPALRTSRTTRKRDPMRHSNASKTLTARRTLLLACSTALAMACTVALPQRAHAARITPPAVPAEIRIEEGNTPFLEGHGVGT